MLTAGITRRLKLPHEPGSWIEIRKLSWTHLDEARRARERAVFAEFRKQGASLEAVLMERCADCRQLKHDGDCLPPEERADQGELSPTNQYDEPLLLRLSLVGWSYEKPVTNAAVADLDAPTLDVLLAAIVVLNELQPLPAVHLARTSAEIARVQSEAGGA